jgi:dynein heavy chain, axonemal
MVASVKAAIGDAVAAYPTTPRAQWALQWPCQAVLTAAAVQWTAVMTDAIAANDSNALALAAERCTSDLGSAVQRVRGALTHLQRATLSALVVKDVHARDVAAELASADIAGQADAFAWTSQLRTYWEVAEDSTSRPDDKGVLVRMASAEAQHGYEYMGARGCLVVTPLTTRCYRCAHHRCCLAPKLVSLASNVNVVGLSSCGDLSVTMYHRPNHRFISQVLVLSNLLSSSKFSW